MSSKIPRAMTIAGSDSGAGSGIQADLKTFAAFGVYGTSVITAVTAQNRVELAAIAEVPEEVVIAQIDSVLEDIGADAIKIGMLSSRTIVENVADRLEAWGPPYLVVDPVMISRTGVPLLQADAIESLARELLPMATIVTPRVSEAEVLAKRTITTADDVREAARAIHALGPKFVTIKGGHLDGSVVDLVFDGEYFTPIEGDRIDTMNTHGAGCTFSAAIAALVAHGLPELDAIRLAKRYVEAALKNSSSIGSGHSPVNHATPLPDEIIDAIRPRVRPVESD